MTRAHSRPSQIFQRTKIGMMERKRVTTSVEKRVTIALSKSVYDWIGSKIHRELLRTDNTIMAVAHHMTLRIAFGSSGITCSEAGALSSAALLSTAPLRAVLAEAVLLGALSPSAVLFLASSEGSSTLYSGTMYSGSFNGCFGVRSDIVVPFVSSHPAPHAVAQGGSRRVSP